MFLLSMLIASNFALATPAQVKMWLPLPSRPDSGSGMYAYEDEDVVESLDGPAGVVRVHYSVAGPNVTLLDDDDLNGLPDFPEEVAATAEEVLQFYQDMGFRAPVSEADMGVTGGGSGAFDFYLVDFAGAGDGAFSIEYCDSEPNICSGYMLMENDFSGYGYSSKTAAIRTLTSHELFHSVQAAYEYDSPIWYTEGTAVWAERQFDPDNEDFISFASAYLEDTSRSLDEPPAAPVPTFAYATCIWWQFMTDRLGPDAIVELQERQEWDGELADTLVEVQAVIEGYGSTLQEEWTTFATWNAATGFQAGILDSYDFAADLGDLITEKTGETIEDENRFFPLATTYYRLDHPGGPLWFTHTDDATGLHFALFSVEGGESIGVLDAVVDEWEPTTPAWYQVGGADLPAGGYFLLGTYPDNADSSQKVQFCLGDESVAESCLEAEDQEVEETPGGCGCAATPQRGRWAGLLVVLALVGPLVRRRRDL